MKVKVFYPNKNDKIEFTRKELEKLLDEVYDDGYADGKKAGTYVYTPPIYYTNKGTSTGEPYLRDYTITCNSTDNSTYTSTTSNSTKASL